MTSHLGVPVPMRRLQANNGSLHAITRWVRVNWRWVASVGGLLVILLAAWLFWLGYFGDYGDDVDMLLPAGSEQPSVDPMPPPEEGPNARGR